jgi:hypothetical protein
MQPFHKKDETPDFSNPSVQQSFVQETQDKKALMQKELDVNRQEQLLLQQRMAMMKSFVNDIPSSDPQYSMMVLQIDMDQIEIDELKARELALVQMLFPV